MSRFHIKVGLLIVGIVTWFWGYRTDNPGLRWIAIGFLAVSFALRFLDRKRGGRDDDGTAAPPGSAP